MSVKTISACLLIVVMGVWASLSLLSAADKAQQERQPTPETEEEIEAGLGALEPRRPRIAMPAGGYFPASWGGGGGLGGFGQTLPRAGRDRQGRHADPLADELFTDPCFWVVSRANNCRYCMGRQELKLRAGGLGDETIAALDADWSIFNPRQQAALAFARKLTLEPHLVGDKDVADLKPMFSEVEIIELAFNIALFNSVNRWTDAIGFSQESHDDADGQDAPATRARATSPSAASIVAPAARVGRGPLPAPDEIAAAIDACRARTPRVELPGDADSRAALAGVIGDRAPLGWERALSRLPVVGKTHVLVWNTILADDHLSPRLKAEIAYITAINNRAWYAAGTAARRLGELKAAPEELVSILRTADDSSGAAVALRFAVRLTVDPHLIGDRDVAGLREHYSDREAAQIIHVICLANLFDRFTEALGLPLE